MRLNEEEIEQIHEYIITHFVHTQELFEEVKLTLSSYMDWTSIWYSSVNVDNMLKWSVLNVEVTFQKCRKVRWSVISDLVFVHDTQGFQDSERLLGRRACLALLGAKMWEVKICPVQLPGRALKPIPNICNLVESASSHIEIWEKFSCQSRTTTVILPTFWECCNV